jgi:hypothetical protein
VPSATAFQGRPSVRLRLPQVALNSNVMRPISGTNKISIKQQGRVELMSTNEPTSSTNGSFSTALYNPTNVAALSLLFSPAFGAYLTAENQKSLGQTEEHSKSIKWFYASIAILVIGAIALKDYAAGVGFWLLVTWYFMSGKKHASYVKENIGVSYQKKSLVKPALIGLAAVAVFVLIVSLLSGGSYIKPGESFLNSELTVREGISETGLTVGSFVKALESIKMDNGKSPVVSGWSKDDNVYILHIQMKEPVEIEFVHMLNQEGKASLMKPVQTSEGEVPAMQFFMLALSSLPQQTAAPAAPPAQEQATNEQSIPAADGAAPFAEAAAPAGDTPAPAATENVTVAGSIDSGTSLSNLSMEDGSSYSFPTESAVANKIFAVCKVGDKCQISAAVEDGENIVKVFSVKKL